MVLLSEILDRVDRFFLMHLSYGRGETYRKALWEFAIKKNVIGLDLDNIINKRFDKYTDKELKELVRVGRITKRWLGQFNLFCHGMKKGDLVIIMAGENRILGVCRVGNYRFNKSRMYYKEFFRHIRRVEWLYRRDFNNPVKFEMPKGYRFTNTIRLIRKEGNKHRPIINSLKKSLKNMEIFWRESEKREIEQAGKRAYTYGEIEESEEHRKLKNSIADNPSIIGLPANLKGEVERLFITDDKADIVFEDKSEGKYFVVEIETYENVRKGAYQALKYKVLLCAEKELEITSNKVIAYLVAHVYDKEADEICKKYGIEYKIL
jgi:predicted Mrr-cat superfamily restriction endonuclease